MAYVWKGSKAGKELTAEQMTFARRCYERGVSAPAVARNLKIETARAESLFDHFLDEGITREGRNTGLPVTLPRLRYMEGSNA